MKTLFLLRHAKSSRNNPELKDHDRNLHKTGLLQASDMGQWMAKNNLLPDLIISSTAVRAKLTAELVMKHSHFVGIIKYEPRIYESSITILLEILRSLEDKYQSVLLVGHNPEFSELASHLSGQIVEMKTANWVHLELPIESWKKCIKTLRGKLINIHRPKQEE